MFKIMGIIHTFEQYFISPFLFIFGEVIKAFLFYTIPDTPCVQEHCKKNSLILQFKVLV